MATQTTAGGREALNAYEHLAPFYDDFTADYAHDAWLAELERLAKRYGVMGRRVIDVAGGTGKSSQPLQGMGYEVTLCDISPAMVSAARRRPGGRSRRCIVADMRDLPPMPPFDLALCLDDSLNYLLTQVDLERALTSIARALRLGGLLVFDVNTIATYVAVFNRDFLRRGGIADYRWTGGGSPPRPGGIFSARIEIVQDGRPCGSGLHRQRHHSRDAILAASRAADLDVLGVHGQQQGGALSPGADEATDIKSVYVLRR